MGHKITKKVLDEDHSSLEAPDESFLKADARMGGISSDFSGSEEDLDMLPSLDEGASDGDSFPKYSLDDFPTSDPSAPGTSADGSEKASDSTSARGSRWGLLAAFGSLPGARWKKTCIAGLSILVIASGIGVTVKRYSKTPVNPKLEHRVTKAIKGSVAISNYKEQMELIVMVNGEKEKNLIAMQLEFAFPAENAYHGFKKDIVLFRDLAYQFASKERPTRNTQRAWQEVVEKKLLSYLKASSPKSGLHSIRIAHWERL